MAIRREVADLLALGPLPNSQEADVAQLAEHEAALARITPPVSDEEALQLCAAFGPDDGFGLAWTLVHLIETAPNGAPLGEVRLPDNEWLRLLRERACRSPTR